MGGVVADLDHLVDVYGPPDDVWEGMLAAGSGISVGCCNGVIPGRTVTSREPGSSPPLRSSACQSR